MSNSEREKVSNRESILKRVLAMEEIGVIIAVIVLCTIIGLVNSKFFSVLNLTTLAENIAYVAIVAIGMTMVMITGGLDLSVGSVMALASCMAALLMTAGVNVLLAIILGLLSAGAFGLFNALLIVKAKIPSFIVTLGSMYIARGIVQAITKGRPIYPLPDSFSPLGNLLVIGIPLCAIILVVLALIANFILKNTVYGRYLYGTGGNIEATRLSGINVELIQISVYIVVSILAGLSGLIMTSKMSSAQISLGEGYEMKIIAAVIIGGTSMMGGIGTILGTMLGAILMGVISNGMVLMRISVFWQQIAIGCIIILAVAIDVIRRRRAGLNS